MLDKMRMRTACFARALQRCTIRLSKHFLLTFQEVIPLSKTRNQLYIKQGKISAVKQEDGSYHIDPSELDRLRELMGADTRDVTPRTQPPSTSEIALLRELLAEKDRTMAEKDRMIQNLLQERDEWREQC